MEQGNGAPYAILASDPDTQQTHAYKCVDKEEVLTNLTTLALVHINENIRGGSDKRVVFEVISIPPEKEEVDATPTDRADDSGK